MSETNEPQENDHDLDGDGDPTVDSRPAAPVQDSRPNTGTDTAGDPDTSDEGVEEGGEMKQVDDSGEVVGRRNEDLPTENLSVPDATS